MIKTVFFDLDGTITDPFEGITRAVEYALTRMGVEVPSREPLKKFIGPPLHDSFSRYYGFDEADTLKTVKLYREYYSDKGIFQNEVYGGVEDTLARLKSDGYKIALATSKPEEFARKILERYGLIRYFDYVCGATFDTSREKKADVVAYALKTSGADASETCMVGDRMHDIEGGKAHGLKTVGVLYGYGDREELENAGADAIIEKPTELPSVLETL